MTASVIELRQEKKEAKFICSACGADRGCQCNAPALEKLAEINQRKREANRRAYEKKKDKENNAPSVTESGADNKAQPKTDPKLAAVKAQAKELGLQVRQVGSTYCIGGTQVATTPDLDEAAQKLAAFKSKTEPPDAEPMVPEKKKPEPESEPEEESADEDGEEAAFDYAEWKKEQRERRKEVLPKGEDDENVTYGDYLKLSERVRKLEERNNVLVVALNAKETEAARDWPADMTAKQIKKRDQNLENIAYWQRELQKLYAEVTDQPSWRVEITDKEGKRFANGLRFALHADAEGYALKQEDVDAFVIACADDKPNVDVNGENIYFRHGDCVLFNWHPVNGTEAAAEVSSSEIFPLFSGNDVDNATSANAAKAAHAAADEDDLTISPLRRTGPEVAS